MKILAFSTKQNIMKNKTCWPAFRSPKVASFRSGSKRTLVKNHVARAKPTKPTRGKNLLLSPLVT